MAVAGISAILIRPFLKTEFDLGFCRAYFNEFFITVQEAFRIGEVSFSSKIKPSCLRAAFGLVKCGKKVYNKVEFYADSM